MTSAIIANFEKMLAAGKDNALLRFGLGAEYLKSGNAAVAVVHLRRAVEHDPGYSAAWKLLGNGLLALGELNAALDAYQKGIAAAEKKGDKQAAKEMTVFAKRTQSKLAGG